MDKVFSNTMLSAKEYEKLIDFYCHAIGLEVIEKGNGVTRLRANKSAQTLCIIDGEAVPSTAIGVESEQFNRTLNEIENSGGKVIDRDNGNCVDPEGNPILVWQNNF